MSVDDRDIAEESIETPSVSTLADQEPSTAVDRSDEPIPVEAAPEAEPEVASDQSEPSAPIADPPSDLDVPDPDAILDPPDETDAPLETPAASFGPSAPVVTTVKPFRVNARGGTSVTLFGAGFVPGCRVFAGTEELIAEVVDSFTLRFVAPEMNGEVEVVVESPSGKRSPPATLQFVEGPVVTRAIPSEGPTEGGIEIILEGTSFSEGCTLNLFGAHAPELTFDSPTRLRFLLPAAGDGPLDGALVVTTFDGLMGRSEDAFRYRPWVPALASVEPNNGWVTGGKLVSLRGDDLHSKARVSIGGKPAVTHHRSRQQIDVEVPPAEAAGAVDVKLENPDGRTSLLEGAFTYELVPAPPKIIDVFPKSGLTTGGLTIRIVGDNFTEAVRVRIGELTAMRRVLSAKLIDADIPPRTSPGAVAIEVALDDIRVRVEDAFTYESPSAPKISSLEPRSGPTGGGTRVVLEGENFPKGATVRFGGEASKSVVVKNAQRIEAVTPPMKGAGLVDVEVSSAETGPGVATKGFRYEAMLPPTIASVSPNRGTIDGGTELSIEGKNFADGCSVIVNGIAVRTKKISGSVLEAHTPGGDDGKLVDVAVKNPDGQTAVQKRAFQYDARYRS
ncbi:MAG: hypothetical protein HOW73_00360 [Polyangiaceae bacterium]|nr:hypothetical protein [Polyangiaceae bacterium]